MFNAIGDGVGLKSFRINKTLKLYIEDVFQSNSLKSFRINKTLKQEG